jgi:hypothetical protein
VAPLSPYDKQLLEDHVIEGEPLEPLRFHLREAGPPTGPSSARSATTATSFKRHPTNCP